MPYNGLLTDAVQVPFTSRFMVRESTAGVFRSVSYRYTLASSASGDHSLKCVPVASTFSSRSSAEYDGSLASSMSRVDCADVSIYPHTYAPDNIVQVHRLMIENFI